MQSSSSCTQTAAQLTAGVPRCLGARPFQAGSRPLVARQARRARHAAAPRQPRPAGLSVAASAAEGALPSPEPSAPQRLAAFADAFWKFLRPHTIRGTILGSAAVTAKAVLENSHLLDWGLLPRAALGVLALLAGNGYIVGINQIYDVEIDAVNKPFLPVASGELSKSAAAALCVALALGGLAIVVRNFGPLITRLYAFGLALGTAYSVPPLRLKNSPVAAFAIIATVRGFLLNFGVYHAVRAALGLPFAWSPPIAFITAFVTVFATAIAVTKDLPDVEGDAQFGVETFATRLGVRRVAWLGAGLLLANYAAAVVLALRMPGAFNAALMAPAHAALGAALLAATARLDRAGYAPPAIAAFYKFVWLLFYSEYALLPFLGAR